MICGGQREKLAEAREEQKWDYIVSIFSHDCLKKLTNYCTEPLRFQVYIMVHAFLLLHSLRLSCGLNCSLWSRYIYRSEFAFLQPLVRPGQACNTV